MNTHKNIVPIFKNLIPADDVEQLRVRFGKHLAGLRIAAISTGDRLESLRHEWLASLNISYDECKFKVDAKSKINDFLNEAEVVIFSGNDADLLEKIFKRHEKELEGSVAICITNKMNPHHRAMLLMAGFDDVVDITKVQKDEFLARCSVIQLRADIARRSRNQKIETELKLNAIADERKLNRRQKMILLELLSSKNNTVSYDSLRQSLSLTHEPISLIQMKVLVCQARKALRPGVQIASLAWLQLPGKGYKLLLNDKVANSEDLHEHSVTGNS